MPPRDIAKGTGDVRNTLRAIMSRWIPLADAVLRMVVRWVPSPIEAQNMKLNSLFSKSIVGEGMSQTFLCQFEIDTSNSFSQVTSKILELQRSVSLCAHQSVNAEASEICIFIAKMIPVRISDLSPIDAAHAIAQLAAQGHDTENALHEQEIFLALGRVFSGSIVSHSHRPLYLLGYHHDPYATVYDDNTPPQTYKEIANPSHLGTYMCLGPSVQPVDCVPAGNIVAIYGLDQYVLKSGTLASTITCYPMTAITFQAKPMLQVAVEPTHHMNLKQIETGLQKLYQYDPVVEVP